MNYFLSFLLFLFQSVHAENDNYPLELFCQDMNIVLMKSKIHTQNIANKNTTRTAKGGPYKRKILKDC